MTPLLNQHQQKDLLRIFTCGSVDDGKSTLIGRLLYDAGLVYEDQLATIVAESERRGLKEPDLSLLLDGLQAEREQGITIDVAYRYFSTAHRKFIVADTPGHEQYTCNMVTGASHCELALILIDARKGVLEQTRRHTAIVNMLGIQHIAMLVNKMDLVAYKESVYRGIQQQVLELADQLGVRNLRFFPVSALAGDNIVHRSEQTPWFQEEPLLTWLESVSPRTADAQRAFRFPVQYVNRPHQDFRGYCGSVLAGQVSVGDDVIVLPNNVANRVRRILHFEGERGAASAGEAVTLELEKETDISRGDVLVRRDDEPMTVTDQFEANVVWMASEALTPGKRYELRLGTVAVPATIKRLIHRLNIHSFAEEDANRLERNDIGRCEVALEQAIPCDRYAEIPATGAFILVDRVSNHTIGAGMITATAGRKVIWQEVQVNKAARAQQKGQTPKVIWFTGLSGSGKSTLANALEQRLLKLGYHSYLLDGDNVRHGLNRDLGFTDEDRVENIRRVGEVAKLMVDAGLLVLVSFISPFRSERQLVREMLEDGEFVEVYVNTPLDVCEQRDSKGLYKLARDGKIPHFTGISSPYEAPDAPELTLNTHETDTETNLNLLLQELKAR